MAVARIPAVAPAAEDVAPPGAPTGPEAAAPVAAAASVAPATSAAARFLLFAYGLVALGWLLGWLLFERRDMEVIGPAPEISAFAILYIFAQAIERFLEPVARLAGTVADDLDSEKASKARGRALVTALRAPTTPNLETLATRQAAVDRVRRNRAAVLWGVASLIALVVCGAFGVLLLNAIGFTNAPAWFDILVTGLAVGSGTKPLHDLISNIQKGKEKKQDPPETGGD